MSVTCVSQLCSALLSCKVLVVLGPNSEVVWVDRIRTCSNKANRDVNVTLAADSSLLGWSRGSTVYGPPGKDRTCTVPNLAVLYARQLGSRESCHA